VTAFRGEDAAMQKISAIILADLARSGRFRAIDHVVAGMLMKTLILMFLHCDKRVQMHT
jgi:hypothetical protein